MDDVIDRRTRLIYASLADHELVRQLQEARLAAAQHRTSHAGLVQPRRRRTSGTRPWAAAATGEDADLVNGDASAPGASTQVVDLREPGSSGTTVDVTAPAMQVLEVRQQPSEWAADDPSYYLG